ncbi:tenascin [Plakobranchus ocellatus]|uniref:Tenascin n=1 Tax=Plakobranchus ocellatus TaxID=259542 RepID=A0AAV4A118_9GAST|nr:tenascin [Plakobranchus ocellatus]
MPLPSTSHRQALCSNEFILKGHGKALCSIASALDRPWASSVLHCLCPRQAMGKLCAPLRLPSPGHGQALCSNEFILKGHGKALCSIASALDRPWASSVLLCICPHQAMGKLCAPMCLPSTCHGQALCSIVSDLTRPWESSVLHCVCPHQAMGKLCAPMHLPSPGHGQALCSDASALTRPWASCML